MDKTQNITRIDMITIPTGVLVHKYPEGWTASTPPVSTTTQETLSLDWMVSWLENDGWTVRRWPGGARAWKGAMLPVRNGGQIKRKRDELRQRWQEWNQRGIQVNALDLAYDL